MLLELLVAAAASARPSVEAALGAMQKAAGERVVVRYGATGGFARQVESGAPFDLFLGADEETARALAAQGLLAPASLVPYREGRLVLVTRRGSPLRLPAVVDAAFLAKLAGTSGGRIAIASPKVAPYGRAAEAALARAGVLASLSGRLVPAGNVEEALRYVESGNAELGFVEGALAAGSGLPSAPLDPALVPPLRQWGGVVARSPRRDAAARALDALVRARR